MAAENKNQKGRVPEEVPPKKKKAERRAGLRTPLSAEEKKTWLDSSRISSRVRGEIFKFAASSLPVFIQGEEGTGKSEVAQALHFLSSWKEAPFLRFFCRELTPERFVQKVALWLKEGEPGKKAAFTLYLEEVERLDWDTQTLLLDLLQNQQIDWPGLEKTTFDAQIISSSSGSLADAVSAQTFRGDLYQALEVLTIAVEPLRRRKEEIPRLVGEIIREKKREGIGSKKFSPEALRALQQHDWPGNLRELEGLVLRAAALKEGDLLLPEDLSFHPSPRRSQFSPGIGEEKGSWFDSTIPILVHEIKNPLVAISTFAHLLPEKYDDPEFRGEFSRLVAQDVKRINELLENLLEFVQFSSPRFTPNDLNSILAEVLRQGEKISGQPQDQITADLGEDLPPVLFDKIQLNFVLRNLLENVYTQTDPPLALHLSTRLSPAEGKEGREKFVDLRVWHDDQRGFLRSLPPVDLEAKSDLQNLSLALLLMRQVMIRNCGQMEIHQGGEAGIAVCLRFPVAQDQK